VIATVLGVVVFAALSLYGDVSALGENLRAFDWSAMVWALLLASGNYCLRFVRWQYYLVRIDVRVPAGESALVFLSGFVMSVTPGKLGEVFKSLLLYESRGISIARTAPVVVAERLTDLMALVVLTALGALSFEQGVPITIAGVCFVLLVWIALAWRPVGELALALVARLPYVKRLVPKLREAYESLRTMLRPWPLLVATFLATVAWGLEVVALGVIVAGLPGASLGWEATTFAYSASTIAGALAMMPGGLGVTEAGMTGLLQVLGGEAMTPSLATAATILVRLATLWWAVVVGFVALALFRRKLRRSAPAAAPAATGPGA
jgi:uncharacterized protein (TIRG00374 family)